MMNNEENMIFNKLLEDREQRVVTIEEMLRTYKGTAICIRANYPGLYKNNKYTKAIVETMKDECEKIFKKNIGYKLSQETYEGSIVLMSIKDSLRNVKLQCISIEENHPLGRLIDIDVYGEDLETINREQLGFNKRSCYICNDYAHNCVRSKKHSMEDIKRYIEEIVDNYIEGTK